MYERRRTADTWEFQARGDTRDLKCINADRKRPITYSVQKCNRESCWNWVWGITKNTCACQTCSDCFMVKRWAERNARLQLCPCCYGCPICLSAVVEFDLPFSRLLLQVQWSFGKCYRSSWVFLLLVRICIMGLNPWLSNFRSCSDLRVVSERCRRWFS